MIDIVDDLQGEMEKVAKRWREYIEEGTNVKPLAPSTVASKIASGSPTPDTPLMDTGEMVDSIEAWTERTTWGAIGHVGSRDPERAWIFNIHEYGLGPPARPTLRPISDEMEKSVFDNLFPVILNQLVEEFLNG